jgi:MFS family permease
VLLDARGLLPPLTRDGWLLFATNGVRLFAYGFIAVVLGLYLAALGLENWAIGVVFTAAIGGGGVMTGLLSAVADRLGRRRVLVLGALLMAVAGVVFALTSNVYVLVAAAVVGTVSPSGREVGPFLSIEQAMLPQTTRDEDRTRAFAAYNIAGSLMGGLGALAAGLPGLLGFAAPESYRVLMWAYAVAGLLLAFLFWQLSDRVEAPERRASERAAHAARDLSPDAARVEQAGAPAARPEVRETPRETPRAGLAEQPARPKRRGLLGLFSLQRSRGPVTKLAALFALDNFASGFVVQGIVSYWFHVRWGVDLKGLGVIAFGTNLFAVVSFIAAPFVARRLGLLLTMVSTHLVSNVLLILVPLMPSAELAIAAWLARYLFAQMDIPPKQSYTMAIVDENERAAASGVFSVSRNIAASVAPAFSGLTLSAPAVGLPFFVAGGLKILYDGLLYAVFRNVKPPEAVVRQRTMSPFERTRPAEKQEEPLPQEPPLPEREERPEPLRRAA